MIVMPEEKLPKLAREICRNSSLVDYHIDSTRLEAAMRRAIAEFLPEAKMWIVRDEAADLIPKVRKLQSTLEKAKRQWDDLGGGKNAVAQFISEDLAPAEIEERFTFLLDLMVEFEEHHKRERGNPGHARLGDKKDLKPLYPFVRVLMDFWVTETGEPFGHHTESADDIADDGLVARSPSMEFLDHASSCIGGYAVGSLETVVRDIKSEEQRA